MPRAFAAELRKERQSLAAEIVREIRTRIPEFAWPLPGRFAARLQLAVETALAEFADLVDGSVDMEAERIRIYRELGRRELAAGRSLDALQAAYRVGARVAWRRYARVARRIGMRPDEMVILAEAVLAHNDLMASASVLGYAQAKADESGALGRRRLRLLEVLVSGASLDEIELVAAAADWPLPARVACAALPGPIPITDVALPEDVLADLERPDAFVLVPDPESRLKDRDLADPLHDHRAVIGPVVPTAMAAESLRWARVLRAKLPAEVLDDAPIRCDARLTELLLLADEGLVRLIGDRRLAALGGLTEKQRRRLEATLLAWLETSRGTAPQVAARLGVHPQTVRRRLHRIHGLFGAVLSDPDARFELEIALRGRRGLVGA